MSCCKALHPHSKVEDGVRKVAHLSRALEGFDRTGTFSSCRTVRFVVLLDWVWLLEYSGVGKALWLFGCFYVDSTTAVVLEVLS